ncbi:MAG TPA: ABC transporter permease subunit [Acidimicrobiales bacterium]|nr:ABC transporter permease subunit [Acidimicrobiales bacterium]
MASIAGDFALEQVLERPDEPPTRRFRRPRFRTWRLVVMLLAGAYFLLPLYAGLKFALQNDAGHFSFFAVKAIPSAQGFTAAFTLSMKIALVTVVLAMLLMVPTTIYVHLRLPRVRRAVEFITILPLVIPPIILITGVLASYPGWIKSSPYLLSFLYVILAMPFVYRSLDAGLGAIDLKTLVEASRSLGGSWVQTLRRVIMPNLRAALLSAMVLTLALVLGEYTMASLDIWETVPVWIVNFEQSDAHITVAASMFGLIGTWVLLTLIVSLDRSQSRRSRRKAGTA